MLDLDPSISHSKSTLALVTSTSEQIRAGVPGAMIDDPAVYELLVSKGMNGLGTSESLVGAAGLVWGREAGLA
jgi:hypothetical protein